MERLPQSMRKYIRKEKARIRREFVTVKEQEEQIAKLYERIKNPQVVAEAEKKEKP